MQVDLHAYSRELGKLLHESDILHITFLSVLIYCSYISPNSYTLVKCNLIILTTNIKLPTYIHVTLLLSRQLHMKSNALHHSDL